MELPIHKRDIAIPEEIAQRWQSVVNIMAEAIQVPAALIMRVAPPYIEVFRSSESGDNPYRAGHKEHLAGLYCERVIKTKDKLLVPDALQDKDWKKNPDIKLGMVSYLGFPLLWPDGEVFGTICVLDLKGNRYGETYERLMVQFKELVEAHLSLLFQNRKLHNALGKLQQRRAEIEALLDSALSVLGQRQFKEVARSLFDSGKNLIGAAAGYVALLSREGEKNEVLFLDTGGVPLRVDSLAGMPSRGLCREAYRLGKAVYHNDFPRSEWTRFMPEGHFPVDNVLFAPLLTEGKAVGLLALANKPGGFTVNDIRLAEVFAELAAVALYNSQILKSLEDSETRFRSVVETASDAIISADSRGNIVFWNRAAETIFGYSAEEIIGKPVTLIMPQRFSETHQRELSQLVSTGEARIVGKTEEVTGLRKDGSEFPAELSLTTWKTGEEVFSASIIRDITERKRAEESIRQLALHDVLTDLPNRRLFTDRLTIALTHAQRSREKLAVMMLDLDNFKEVNDTLGHNVGDQLLQGVSWRLSSLLRKSDTVARLGGDEFIVLLLGIARGEDSVRIAQKVLESLRQPFVVGDHELRITASIGIAVYPDDGDSAEILVKNADIAMYHAKKEGRNNHQRYTSGVV